MGLRFRKSITLIPGVRINLGKTGASVSIGGHGLTKTFHSSGRVTTTASIPGTGISYVDVQNPKKTQTAKKSAPKSSKTTPRPSAASSPKSTSKPSKGRAASSSSPSLGSTPGVPTPAPVDEPRIPDIEFLRCIHRTSDDPVDWHEIALSAKPPEYFYDGNLWDFMYSMSAPILDGDIDAYLSVIGRMEPVDDLLSYGNKFVFGTDNPKRLHVEFEANHEILNSAAAAMTKEDYNDLLQDFLCSVCLRVGRDIFALLPVEQVFVHAVLANETVVSAMFDREHFTSLKFAYADASDLLKSFPHRMDYSKKKGLSPIVRIR